MLPWPVSPTTTEDGWYLILPSSWDGQIAVERDDRENHRGEQAVVFYHQEYDGSLTRFMTIYRLTGTNREARANLGSRQPVSYTHLTLPTIRLV